MPSPLRALLLALPLPLAPQAAPVQEEPTATQRTLAAATPEARREWTRLVVASSGTGGERRAITAFELEVQALIRDGVQTNETRFRYRYLAPDLIRFTLPSGDEVGRYGRKAREHWLRSKEDRVISLAASDYLADRRQIQQMHAVARNFVALSDLAGLQDLTRLELLDAPPVDLPRGMRALARDLRWLRVASPSFALRPAKGLDDAPRAYTVELGLAAGGETGGLPRLAIIREDPQPGASPVSAPMLIALERYEERDGFRIPLTLFVHNPDARMPPLPSGLPRFGEKPSQEIYVLTADLRPGLSVDAFRPE